MSNAPAWLRCEFCLWFVFASDEAGSYTNDDGQNEDWGCHIDRGRSNGLFDRCSDWNCKRCFQAWHAGGKPVNHLYCPIVARKKPVKEAGDA